VAVARHLSLHFITSLRGAWRLMRRYRTVHDAKDTTSGGSPYKKATCDSSACGVGCHWPRGGATTTVLVLSDPTGRERN
jgi:hypothetical protein